MESKFNAKLWKIGTTIVFTIPHEVVNEFGKNNYIIAKIFIDNDRFEFIMKSWKCGGSVVLTVPAAYVAAFGLKEGNMVDIELIKKQ